MKEKLKQTKGITLIALIITIIILLILAVVSIRLVINNGIIGKAEKGVNDYSQAEADEQEKLLQAEYEMAKYEGKFSGTYEEYAVEKLYGVKIGDYVNYDPTKDAEGNTITGEKATYTSYAEANASTDKNEGRSSGYTTDQVFNLSSYTGGWRVLGIENGKLQLISADIIEPDSGGYTSGSNKYYYLKGQQGYINGEAELNAISSMYGQGSHSTGARSVNVDDLNKITGYDPSNTGDGKPYGSGNTYEYGNKVTYSWLDGNIVYRGTNGVNGTSGYSTFQYYDESSRSFKELGTDETKELTSTVYYYYPTTLTASSSGDLKGIETTSEAWKLLFENTASKYYWLASPYYYVSYGYADFGLRYVYGEYVSISSLFYSHDIASSGHNGIRPVVSLSSDIQIEKTDVNDGSTLEKACIIK